jgi:hypothetical protein
MKATQDSYCPESNQAMETGRDGHTLGSLLPRCYSALTSRTKPRQPVVDHFSPRCVLMSYADSRYRYVQELQVLSARKYCRFDQIHAYGPEDIDPDFRARHDAVLKQRRGGGYWLWKSYLIDRTLRQLPTNSVLMYSDAGAVFVADCEPLLSLCASSNCDVVCFELMQIERMYTKRDTFVMLNCDSPEFTRTRQRLGSFMIIRKSENSSRFVREWLHWSEDPRLLTDMQNTQGLPDYADFIDHRHDQSIFSLLTKKHGLPAFRDPSQWGNSVHAAYPNSPYPQIINHVRRIKRPWLLQKSPLELCALQRSPL